MGSNPATASKLLGKETRVRLEAPSSTEGSRNAGVSGCDEEM